MADRVLRAPGEGPTPLWLDAAGRLVGPCADLPCDPCGGGGEPGVWVRGTACACGDGAGDAWMREGDLAALRQQGTCPTGRLPDGSCWEVLVGAERRSFAEPGPPASQRLAPHGVNGCCYCCPGCVTTPVLYPQQDDASTIRLEEFDRCCADGDTIVGSGFYRRDVLELTSSACGEPGVGLRQRTEGWVQCDASGCVGVARDRRWLPAGSVCELDRDRIQEDSTGPLSCRDIGLYMTATGIEAISTADGFPFGQSFCGTGQYFGRSGPTGATWSSVERRSAGGDCVPWIRRTGVWTRSPVASSPCRGRCVRGVLGPAIPPPPTPLLGLGGGPGGGVGGGLLAPSRNVVVPGRAQSGGGCSGCGNDGGL